MLQLLRFGRSYQAIADTTCSATTIRTRRGGWMARGRATFKEVHSSHSRWRP
jgi:hypothetical protein